MTVLREAETPPLGAEHSKLWCIHADDKLCEVYDYTKLLYLAQGSSGVVYSTTRIGTDVKVAVKRMRFSDDPGFLERYKDRWHGHTEVTILESLKGFPGVCQLLDKFEDATTLDLIFELIPGGDLLTEVLDRDLGEKTTKHIALQICRTMAKLHKTKQIVHRDLKLQNILVSDDSNTPTVTIVDFGSAKQTSLSKMNTLCGTVGYIAPEVTKGPYGCRIDVFGFGMCLLFMFLSGCRDVIEEILADGLTMDYLDSLLEKKGISLDGKNLLKKTLAVNPDDRISFDDALKEPFFAATASELNTTSVTTTAHREGPGKVTQRTGSLTLRQNDGVPEIEEALRSPSKRSFEEVDDATLRRSESDRKRSRFEAQDEEQDQLLPGEPRSYIFEIIFSL
ncbi:kinase-like domain-containing protein [Mycena olivaceomarginata]|nr:kinase-like domain-containing protein [Mycena olivaceomarginata]